MRVEGYVEKKNRTEGSHLRLSRCGLTEIYFEASIPSEFRRVLVSTKVPEN